MTARLAACHDLTKNGADLERIRESFLTLQTGATPTALLLPWFPSPARNAVKKGTTGLFTLLQNYVEARRDAEPTSDAIDILIATGETTQQIVGASFVPRIMVNVNSDSTSLVRYGDPFRGYRQYWYDL